MTLRESSTPHYQRRQSCMTFALTTSCTLAAPPLVERGTGAAAQVLQDDIRSQRVASTTSKCVVGEKEATLKHICSSMGP